MSHKKRGDSNPLTIDSTVLVNGQGHAEVMTLNWKRRKPKVCTAPGLVGEDAHRVTLKQTLCEDLQLFISTDNYEKEKPTISEEAINGVSFGNTKPRHWEKIKTGKKKEIRHDSAKKWMSRVAYKSCQI